MSEVPLYLDLYHKSPDSIKKLPPPKDHRTAPGRPTVGSQGVAVSYERGTPVVFTGSRVAQSTQWTTKYKGIVLITRKSIIHRPYGRQYRKDIGGS